jgi:hypothetical protein
MFETASDRQIFVKDFGKDVLIRGSVIGFRRVKAIFDNEYEGIVGESVEFATSVPRLTCISDDVKNLAYGDVVEIDGLTYKATVIMPDGTGVTELMLELQ